MWQKGVVESAYICGDFIPENLSSAKEGEGRFHRENVVQRVEERLSCLEARVKTGKGGQMLRQKVELVKRKLQRYYFLRRLLPLSKCPAEFVAFIEKSKVIP